MANIKRNGEFIFDGLIMHFKDGEFHREDGPAIEGFNGEKYWYYYGKQIDCITQEQFIKIINMRAFW